MGWRGGNFSVSYDEILQALANQCKMADGSVDRRCLERMRRLKSADADIAARFKEAGVPYTTMAEGAAYRAWQNQRYGGNVQAEAFLGPFERPAAEYALKNKTRVVVDYGSGLPTSYEVTVEGPHGAERSIETRDRREAAAFGATAEKLFGKLPSSSLEEDRELMRILMSLFGEA